LRSASALHDRADVVRLVVDVEASVADLNAAKVAPHARHEVRDVAGSDRLYVS
jgi:hypothetical protein